MKYSVRSVSIVGQCMQELGLRWGARSGYPVLNESDMLGTDGSPRICLLCRCICKSARQHHDAHSDDTPIN